MPLKSAKLRRRVLQRPLFGVSARKNGAEDTAVTGRIDGGYDPNLRDQRPCRHQPWCPTSSASELAPYLRYWRLRSTLGRRHRAALPIRSEPVLTIAFRTKARRSHWHKNDHLCQMLLTSPVPQRLLRDGDVGMRVVVALTVVSLAAALDGSATLPPQTRSIVGTKAPKPVFAVECHAGAPS